MREKPRLKNAQKKHPKVTKQIRFRSWTVSPGPQKSSFPLDAICLSRKSRPRLAQKGSLEHRAGRPGSLGPGKRLPQLATWLPLGELHAPQVSGRAEPKSLGPLGTDPWSWRGTVQSHQLASLQAPALEIWLVLLFLWESGEGDKRGQSSG